MNFGQAVEAAKQGKRVAREGWNGASMFAFIVPANKYPVERFPESQFKDIFADDMVPFCAYWLLKTAQNDIAMWSPSGSDSLAEDWMVVE